MLLYTSTSKIALHNFAISNLHNAIWNCVHLAARFGNCVNLVAQFGNCVNLAAQFGNCVTLAAQFQNWLVISLFLICTAQFQNCVNLQIVRNINKSKPK